ncbi:MAG TPA: hypothetical protein VND64_08785 [Pirellulales bacterium]|nr:hypothetical protein [Pirellulales bacterium]
MRLKWRLDMPMGWRARLNSKWLLRLPKLPMPVGSGQRGQWGHVPSGPQNSQHRRMSGIVVKLAQAIYDEQAFARLPNLADALEQAGCHDTDILDHCRRSGPHIRGCWVVDLMLRKEFNP